MAEPRLPNTVYMLAYHFMGESWRRQFFMSEVRALQAQQGHIGSRLYVVTGLDNLWKELD